MKKNRKLALTFAAVVSLATFAQPAANLKEGFYRVQNHLTKRYAYVLDNRGSINYANVAVKSSADMAAIALFSQEKRERCADPASVCYIERVSHKHDILGQSTSLFGIIDHYVQIQDVKTAQGKATYQITPLKEGYDIYLRDKSRSTNSGTSNIMAEFNKPAGTKNSEDIETFYWDFIPFTPNGDEYLGIASNEAMKVGGKYYKPYVIGFDMTLLSPGMKAYYVSDIKTDAIIIKEISGTIPYNTPVIIECSSADPSSNRVDVSINKSPRINNKLKANYFCYENHGESAYTVYNPQTMRVLKVKDGKLVFGKVASDDSMCTTRLPFSEFDNDTNMTVTVYKQCLSANSSYIEVSSGFPDDVPVMTQEEYNILHGAGDFDNSGTVTSEDVKLGLVPMLLKQITENLPQGDVNGDGCISISDVTALIRYMISKK